MKLVLVAYGLRDPGDERDVRAGVEDALAGQPGEAWEVAVLWYEQFESYAFRIKRDGEIVVAADDRGARLAEDYARNVVPDRGRSQLRQAVFEKVRAILTRPSPLDAK